MAFTLLGFNEVPSASASEVNLAGAKDQSAHVEDDTIYIPAGYTKLLMCCAMGWNLSRGVLESPSLRRLAYLRISPTNNLETIHSNNLPEMWARYTLQSPLSFIPDEGLEAKVYVSIATDDFATVGVLLGDAPAPPVRGDIWSVRFTGDGVANVVSQWVNQEITFSETLPVGRYQIVGAQVWAHSNHLFRFVPIGAYNRPGGMCLYITGQHSPEYQRLGNMGVWCEFDSKTPPSLDLLGQSTASHAPSGIMDLIKIA